MDQALNPAKLKARMRHRCNRELGCYLRELHAPIHLFADCFPNNIRFTDVDGVVERNGQFLFLEWKRNGSITEGQDILFRKLSQLPECTPVFIRADFAGAYCDSPSGKASLKFTWWRDGKKLGPFRIHLCQARRLFQEWADAANSGYQNDDTTSSWPKRAATRR